MDPMTMAMLIDTGAAVLQGVLSVAQAQQGATPADRGKIIEGIAEKVSLDDAAAVTAWKALPAPLPQAPKLHRS